MYQKIDLEKLQCLNEVEEGSGKTVFKPWDERLDKSKVILMAGKLGGEGRGGERGMSCIDSLIGQPLLEIRCLM